MAKLGYGVLLAFLVLFFITGHEAVGPLFLQAITSALATIPMSGGPMTTGLLGAKLGIGTKLLYYLGFFGRRSKPIAKKAVPVSSVGKAPGGLQPVPLPYVLSGAGGFPQMGGGGGLPPMGGGGFQQMGGGGFPQMGGGGFGNSFGGGFQQMVGGLQQMGGGGFGGGGFQQSPFGGIDPSQVFAALRAQGYDPNTAMQLLNYGNGGGFGMGGDGGFMGGEASFDANAGNFPPNIPAQGQFPPSFNPVPGQGIPNQGGNFEEDHGEPLPHQPSEHEEPGQETDDVESFFTFLRDMDENSCISRLICDIGADPSFLGEFSENIHNIVGSLDVTPTSGAFPYIAIMESGRNEGGCNNRFPECSDTAYEIVKNVAPSVGVPQNINSAAVNQL